MSLVRESTTVETISNMLLRPHSNANDIVLILKWLYPLVPFSSLVL